MGFSYCFIKRQTPHTLCSQCHTGTFFQPSQPARVEVITFYDLGNRDVVILCLLDREMHQQNKDFYTKSVSSQSWFLGDTTLPLPGRLKFSLLQSISGRLKLPLRSSDAGFRRTLLRVREGPAWGRCRRPANLSCWGPVASGTHHHALS